LPSFQRLDSSMSEITIATSIIPRNFEHQRTAINSWINLGFKVISINSAEEAAIVSEYFPDIPVKITDRTALATTGKPYVYFDDVCKSLIDLQSDVCGIVNSDIFLSADAGFIDFISEAAADGLLFGSRIDVDSMTNLDGEKFICGFDFFFFSKSALKLFPESEFCLGVPWWDYWAPLAPLVQGIPCKELISPVAYHVKHETKWANELYCDYGKIFSDKVSQLAQQPCITCTITNESSPEQLTVFSFDILQYILKNSVKVFYPNLDYGGGRIAVGRSQYLALRDQVIAHHKKIWELSEQIMLANKAGTSCDSEINAIRSSLSWRITKPLRWLGDRLRGLGTGG